MLLFIIIAINIIIIIPIFQMRELNLRKFTKFAPNHTTNMEKKLYGYKSELSSGLLSSTIKR